MSDFDRLRVGLAGAGYWGSKLARNISEAQGCRLAAICDEDEARLDAAVGRYSVEGCSRLADLLALDGLDAVVLATPASAHAEHARAVLEAGKHVLVEKPLALSSSECAHLTAIAEERGLTLMVGHTFVYSEPVRMLRDLIRSGELGRLLYIYGQRVNLGTIREDLNALWNFGPHDISILLYLLDEEPVRVSARQFPLLERRLEDVAFVIVEFSSGVIAHIHDSWVDPRKVRSFTVVGERKMVVYDDTDVETPLRIYDKGVTRSPYESPGPEDFGTFEPGATQGFGEFKLEVRAGDMLAPRVNAREPLGVEIEHFAECVRTGRRPLTDGEHGRQVVSVLEAADASTSDDGRAVAIRGALAHDVGARASTSGGSR
jgi:predicted dehydrogenase